MRRSSQGPRRQGPRQGHARRHAVGGAAIGGALGLLLFMFFPVLGLAVGAIAGGLIGHAVGDHIDSDFVRDVTDQARCRALGPVRPDRGRARRGPGRAATDRGRHAHPDDPGPGARGRGPPGRRIAPPRRRRARRTRHGCGSGSASPIEDVDGGAVAVPGRSASWRCREDGRLRLLWVYDHLLFRDDGETTGIHECWTILSAIAEATSRARARHDRDVHRVPQPGPAREDGRHARPRQRRPADPGHRLRLARPGVRGLRLPDRPQGRAVRGLAHDHPLAPDPRRPRRSRGRFHASTTRSLVPPARAGLPILVAAKRPRMFELTATYALARRGSVFSAR